MRHVRAPGRDDGDEQAERCVTANSHYDDTWEAVDAQSDSGRETKRNWVRARGALGKMSLVRSCGPAHYGAGRETALGRASHPHRCAGQPRVWDVRTYLQKCSVAAPNGNKPIYATRACGKAAAGAKLPEPEV